MDKALEAWRATPVRWVELGGTRVAYRKVGRGPAVVMVHGWPLSGATWRGLVQRLQHEFTFYVPDLPGAGDSPWDPSTREAFHDFGVLVHRFADAMQLEEHALVGHDSGGTMARIAASLAPGRVNALVLTNTEVPGHAPKLVRLFQILLSLPGSRWLFDALLRSRAYRRSALGFGGCFGDLAFLDGEFHQACIEPLLRDSSGAMAMLRNCDLGVVRRLAEIHARIEAPLLCVWGDRDPFFPLPRARAMVQAWPGDARIEVIAGKKLFVHEEAPDEVAALLRPFLLEHTGARPARAIPA
jgi:pimeloyl-ACP methyl ester carboxylesterase